MIKCIVFDLDGTLIKSHKTIFKATVKTLEQLGLQTKIEKNQFYNLLGHHFQDIFNECNIHVPDVEYFIKIYKDIYFDYIDDSQLYNNSVFLLKELKKRNINIGLLTTKGHDQAIKIANHFRLDLYLDSIEGRKNGVAIKPSPDQFLNICERLNTHPQNSLMIGDTDLDIKCGKAAGSQTCAVSYGYRDVEELKSYSPDFIIDDLKEVLNVI